MWRKALLMDPFHLKYQRWASQESLYKMSPIISFGWGVDSSAMIISFQLLLFQNHKLYVHGFWEMGDVLTRQQAERAVLYLYFNIFI